MGTLTTLKYLEFISNLQKTQFLQSQQMRTELYIVIVVRVESTETKINEMTVEVVNLTSDVLQSEETEKKFSVRQSNTLYLLFCISTSLCIWGDLWHQSKRGNKTDKCRAPGRSQTYESSYQSV